MIILADNQKVKLYWAPVAFKLENKTVKTLQVDDQTYQLQAPELTSELVTSISKACCIARQHSLVNLTVAEIVTLIDQAIEKWCHPDYPQRILAEKLLPAITGYDHTTVALEIKRFVRNFRKKELWRFIDTELDNPAILDDFHPQKSGQLTKAIGPTAIFHVFSSNIPGLQIWSLIMGLITKSANLGKTSLSEPLFPVLFSQTLAEVSPELAATIAILPWKGGTHDLEQAAIDSTNATIVYGSDRAVKSIHALVPDDKIFLHYGYKISFAMIGAEALTPEYYPQMVQKMAEDIAVYDQQSCLSPQTVFVEAGGTITPHQFAQLLAKALANNQLKWPRAKLTTSEAVAVTRLRQESQIQALTDATIQVIASPDSTAWTVVYHQKPALMSSPLNRTIHVMVIDDLAQVPALLRPYQPFLQSCGLAVAPQRLLELGSQLGDAGIDRICAIGDMTRAQSGWHHDGRFNLLDLLKMVDIEPGAEALAEHFDPDVE